MFKNAYCFKDINKFSYLSTIKSNKEILEIPEYNDNIKNQIKDLNEEYQNFIKELLNNTI